MQRGVRIFRNQRADPNPPSNKRRQPTNSMPTSARYAICAPPCKRRSRSRSPGSRRSALRTATIGPAAPHLSENPLSPPFGRVGHAICIGVREDYGHQSRSGPDKPASAGGASSQIQTPTPATVAAFAPERDRVEQRQIFVTPRAHFFPESQQNSPS